MKANKAQLERALKSPAEVRFFLFHGPDEAASRALASGLGHAAGADAERIELTGASLREDPARLTDEAAAISMFGGQRYVVVDPAGDESVNAAEALLSAPAAGNPVALVAGTLRATSKLLKLALAEDRVVAFASYPPSGREADQMVTGLAREHGLAVQPDVAQRLWDLCAGNRAVLARELEKYACFLDASPASPKPLDSEAVDAVSASSEEGDLTRLTDSAAGGDPVALQAEIDRLAAEGIKGIPLIRALLRRTMLLARLRAEVDAGRSPGAVMASQGKAVFQRDKPGVERQLARWPSDRLARAIERLGEAERQVKASRGIGDMAADEALTAICREAARLRLR